MGSWGCGAYCQETSQWLQLHWPQSWASINIAVKELLPIFLCAAIWGLQWHGSTVLFYCDNEAVVSRLSFLSAREPYMCHLLCCLFFFEARFRFEHRARHIAGKLNTAADAISCNFFLCPQAPGSTPSNPNSKGTNGLPHGQLHNMDLASLEGLVRGYFTGSIASRTRSSYSSAQHRYLTVCQITRSLLFHCQSTLCLYAAFLANHGLKFQSISVYLSALRYLQVSAGQQAPQRHEWPRLQYVLKGIARQQPYSGRRRLPITASIMRQLQVNCFIAFPSRHESSMLWAACCLGYFGFMRTGEFTSQSKTSPGTISFSDLAIDSHSSPSLLCIKLRKAKTDPFGNGVDIYMAKTGTTLCPVSAILDYIALRPGKGRGATSTSC